MVATAFIPALPASQAAHAATCFLLTVLSDTYSGYNEYLNSRNTGWYLQVKLGLQLRPLNGRAGLVYAGNMTMIIPRVGVATDVHAFSDDPECELWLACLRWEGPGLKGHSDADVAAHAACDAVLQAADLGDLGSNFGTDRPEWAGASGAAFLGEVARLVAASGLQIGNVAVQVVGNKPRMGRRYAECNAAMSRALGAPVTVSATTSDGLGFTGRGEGVAAVATAVVFPRQDGAQED